MKRSMSIFIVVISVILTLAVTAAAGLSVMTYLKVSAIEAASVEEIPEGSVEGEDNITIGGQYVILSTKAISDAYISGDSSALDERDAETLKMASDILDEIITDGMTDYEKEQAVFTWMNENIGTDSQVNVLVRDDASTDNPHGVLSGRDAVCVGFATTFRLFMQMLDIPCMVVHNTELVHSWDLVQIDGNWYHTDLYSAQNTKEPMQYLNRSDRFQSTVGYGWDMSFYPAANSLDKCYVYEKAERVGDAFAIPASLREAIDEKRGFASFIIPKTDDSANIAESMLSSIESKLMNSVEYQNAYFTHTIIETDDDKLLIFIQIQTYDEDNYDYDYGLSEDIVERIDEAVGDSFGDLTQVEYDDYYY